MPGRNWNHRRQFLGDRSRVQLSKRDCDNHYLDRDVDCDIDIDCNRNVWRVRHIDCNRNYNWGHSWSHDRDRNQWSVGVLREQLRWFHPGADAASPIQGRGGHRR